MKMRDLEVWGVPSYMVDIWEKNYSPYLLPVQEKAVRDYGVLDYEEGKIRPHPTLSPQGQG
jgi:helicase